LQIITQPPSLVIQVPDLVESRKIEVIAQLAKFSS